MEITRYIIENSAVYILPPVCNLDFILSLHFTTGYSLQPAVHSLRFTLIGFKSVFQSLLLGANRVFMARFFNNYLMVITF